ncbi:MAG: ATP-binding protein [Flavobacteriales bacterium]
MAPRSPIRIAWLIALAGACCTALLLLLQGRTTGAALGLPLSVLAVVVVGTCVFGVAWYLIRRYVQDRVDLIYRTIHDTRTGRVPDVEGDLFGAVNADVGAWVRERRAEISELNERERFRREFIGNLAHELRTPIFNIQGYILTLLEGGLEDSQVNRDFLERASNGVDRMIRIVEDLDLITQLESGVMTMTRGRMDLKELVDEMIASMEMKAAEKGITLRNTLENEVYIRADRGRMAQVFSNLFTNAINYGTPGGWCEVRAFDMGDHVLVEVADNGIGIAAEHQPRLFERFYRVGKSRARNEGGSGLGLAIVKHIIEAHEGTIAVKSKEGEGAVFRITLPKAGR